MRKKLKLSHPDADIYVPAGNLTAEAALAGVTHLCVAAHPDDIETMAYDAIAACFGRAKRRFGGVTMTAGAGSARTGAYAKTSNAEMRAIRRHEQRKAALVGNYAIQFQLGYASEDVKDPKNAAIQRDLRGIFAGAPALDVVYLHQPADKHDTHVACLVHALAAIRSLPEKQRPRRVLGCEGWRDLDWLCDDDKQVIDVSAYPHLAAALIGVFDSQITGGKRYDLAIPGRWRGYASLLSSHAIDKCEAATVAIDLTPLVHGPEQSLTEFTVRFIDRFRQDVVERLEKFAPSAGRTRRT